MRWLALALAFAGCGNHVADDRPAPRPVAPQLAVPVTVPPLDAAVIDAPPDAALWAGRMIAIAPAGIYEPEPALITPGLPRFDRAANTIIVGEARASGLPMPPNLRLWTLDAVTAKTVSTLTIWSVEQWSAGFPVAGLDDPPTNFSDPVIVNKLLARIQAIIDPLEPKLGALAPMTACTQTEDPGAPPGDDSDGQWMTCYGADSWACGEVTVHYRISKRGDDLGRHDKLELIAGGKTTTIPTTSWRNPPVKTDMEGPHQLVKSRNCIASVHEIPDSKRLLIELAHMCNVSGDWCSAGDNTWHIVTAP